MTHEFTAWPKTPRLFRDIVVTEKLDGTNAAIHVNEDGTEVTAQSRKRIITPDADNYGFARWVHDNAGALVDTLGPGLHFGEWWGSGIQRAYGYRDGARRFSLFNTVRHEDTDAVVGDVRVQPVPVLYAGPFSEMRIRVELAKLRMSGSVAAPGFMDPEGICVFHTQSRDIYKVTLDNNDAGKWEAA